MWSQTILTTHTLPSAVAISWASDWPAIAGLIVAVIGIIAALIFTYLADRNMRKTVSAEGSDTRRVLGELQEKLQADTQMALDQLVQRLSYLNRNTGAGQKLP